MKTNNNFAALYVGVSLIWCIFLVSFAFSPQAIDSEGIFLCGVVFVLIATTFAPYHRWSGETTGTAIIVSIVLVLFYSTQRFFASRFYDHLKFYEDYSKIALRPAGAPDSFPIINSSLVLFTALGFLYITVAFLYWLKAIRKRSETPALYPWRFYFKSFFSLTRLLFLCMPLLLIVLVSYVHEVYGYRGVGSHRWGAIMIFCSLPIFNPFIPRKVRGIVAMVFVSFLILLFFNTKNYEYMLFSMRSSLNIAPESLGVDETLKELLSSLADRDKEFLSLPEYRGNILLFVGSGQAPNPVVWKDFILIIPIGLYMLLNIIFEPHMES